MVGQMVTIPPREDAGNGREEVHGDRGLPLGLFVWWFLVCLALFLCFLFFHFCLLVQWGRGAPHGSAEGQKYINDYKRLRLFFLLCFFPLVLFFTGRCGRGVFLFFSFV